MGRERSSYSRRILKVVVSVTRIRVETQKPVAPNHSVRGYVNIRIAYIFDKMMNFGEFLCLSLDGW